jgi:hypothetical protein
MFMFMFMFMFMSMFMFTFMFMDMDMDVDRNKETYIDPFNMKKYKQIYKIKLGLYHTLLTYFCEVRVPDLSELISAGYKTPLHKFQRGLICL